MPIRWNVPEHSAVLERLDVVLDPDAPVARGGAVVLGPDGVGKSTLARVAAENFASRHPGTLIRWVTGTPTERVVPFGAFSHLVQIADIGKPAALLRAARASLGSADREGTYCSSSTTRTTSTSCQPHWCTSWRWPARPE